MSILPPNPIAYAQEVGVAKLAQANDVRLDSAQDTARGSAQSVLRQQGQQIQTPEATSLSAEVDEEGGGGGGSSNAGHHGGAGASGQQEEGRGKGGPSKDNPLLGNLLNVKV